MYLSEIDARIKQTKYIFCTCICIIKIVINETIYLKIKYNIFCGKSKIKEIKCILKSPLKYSINKT